MRRPDDFKKLLDRPGIVVAPGVFDAITAKLAAQIGFEAVYIGSYASGATLFGLPDTGFLGRSDMLDQVWRIAGAVDLPIIADAEGGFGNAVHVVRTVREFERAGAAAIHLEDHEFGKHVTSKTIILPLSKAIDKIKAAVDARSDPNFQIIARTDAALSEELGLENAIERGVALAEAGADMIFVAGLGMKDLQRAVETIPVPLLNTDPLDKPGTSTQEMEAAGLKVVIYFALSHFLAYTAVRDGLSALRRDGSTASLVDKMPSMEDFDSFLGVPEVRELAERYQVLS